MPTFAASRMPGSRASPAMKSAMVKPIPVSRPPPSRSPHVTLWGSAAGVRLVELALFCDTDQTGAESVAYFSNVRGSP